MIRFPKYEVLSPPSIYLSLRIVVGLIFIVSGLAKLWDLDEFVEIVSRYSIGESLGPPYVAVAICIAELLFGLGLILGANLRASALCLFVMMIGFTVMSSWGFLEGRTSDCGCFGKLITRKSDLGLVIENLLICAALFLILRDSVRTKGKRHMLL